MNSKGGRENEKNWTCCRKRNHYLPKPKLKKHLFKGKGGLEELCGLFRHVCLSQVLNYIHSFVIFILNSDFQ